MTELNLDVAFKMFLTDMGASYSLGRNGLFQYNGFVGTKEEITNTQEFQGYAASLVGHPSPHSYRTNLFEERPQVRLSRSAQTQNNGMTCQDSSAMRDSKT